MGVESARHTDRRSPGRLTLLWHRLSDLAVVSGMYTVGSMAAVYLLVGHAVDWSVVGAAGLCAVGLYLIDRVKLRDQDLDPADLAAMPHRYEFLARHTQGIRVGSLGLFAVSSVLFAQHHPWLSALPPLGLISVVLYSLGPRHGRRPKDQLLLKNAIVAAAVVCLGGVVLWAHGVDPGAPAPLFTLAWLGAVVLGDAALSDLDDSVTDQQFETHTLPNTMGHPKTWIAALLLQAVAGVGLLRFAPVLEHSFWLAIGVPVSTLGLWLLRPRHVRDLVDLRLPLLAAVVLLAQRMG